MKILKQISQEWWQKQTTLSADRASFEAGYNAAGAWIPISEYQNTHRDVILKVNTGRVFRGHIDNSGDVFEFDGFEVENSGSSYVGVGNEKVEYFKSM